MLGLIASDALGASQCSALFTSAAPLGEIPRLQNKLIEFIAEAARRPGKDNYGLPQDRPLTKKQLYFVKWKMVEDTRPAPKEDGTPITPEMITDEAAKYYYSNTLQNEISTNEGKLLNAYL